MLIAVVIPFALTLVVGKRRLSSKELGTEERSEAPDAEASPVDVPAEGIARALVSPLSGTVAPIDEMPDAVFSSKCMGDGLYIELCSSTPTPSRMSPLIARSFWATTSWRSTPPTSPGDIELFSANAEKRQSVSCSRSTPPVQRRCWPTSLIASSSVLIAGRSERKGYCR